jgi:hypothetical protein
LCRHFFFVFFFSLRVVAVVAAMGGGAKGAQDEEHKVASTPERNKEAELHGELKEVDAPPAPVVPKQSRRLVPINVQKLCSQCQKYPTPNTCSACGVPVCRECKVVFNGLGVGRYFCKEHSKRTEEQPSELQPTGSSKKQTPSSSNTKQQSKSRTPQISSKSTTKVEEQATNTRTRAAKRKKETKSNAESSSASSDSLEALDELDDKEEVPKTQLTSSKGNKPTKKSINKKR